MHPASKVIGPDPHYRVRGTGVSRVEAICDAMFGFGITFLIVNVGTGGTYEELLRFVRGTPAFAFCFLILARIWYSHYQFHRRFGLEDGPTIALNLALMLVVLCFVFPLKILVGYTTDFMIGSLTHHRLDVGAGTNALKVNEVAYLLEVFAGGFALVNLIFGLLYLHAFRLSDSLEMDPLEVALTKFHMQENWVVGGMFTLTACLLEWQGFRGLVIALGFQFVAVILRRLIRRRIRNTVARDALPTEMELGR